MYKDSELPFVPFPAALVQRRLRHILPASTRVNLIMTKKSKKQDPYKIYKGRCHPDGQTKMQISEVEGVYGLTIPLHCFQGIGLRNADRTTQVTVAQVHAAFDRRDGVKRGKKPKASSTSHAASSACYGASTSDPYDVGCAGPGMAYEHWDD
ncbi:hypothetical protein HDZ31DRAFT_60732 [Schizophyllum fasciatum]